MLITKTFHDVPSKLDNGRPIRIFVVAPIVSNYPQAKFPGKPRYHISYPIDLTHFVDQVWYASGGPDSGCTNHTRLFMIVSEIYQVTGPVERFAGQIASQGYVVACPSSYHEFETPDPIPYDVEGLPCYYPSLID